MTPATEPAHMDFGPLRIAYDDRVLRPRPWTAAQSEWAAECCSTAPPGPVLELCAGAGPDRAAGGRRRPRRLVCVDLNPVACAYARSNAAAAGLADRVEVREGAMDEVLRPRERFALVIADPPWVRRAEVGRYPEDPPLAIDGGDDGLDVAWTLPRHRPAAPRARRQRCSCSSAPSSRSTRCASGCAGDSPSRVTEVRWRERGVLVRLVRP